ncbi:hypothetical protein [Hymenobacter antarcticus]|uniref:Uncharacterized protein n=1 Tax=Hymenobacter antarcticus TaxID=486270 RepID=A0ABP7PZY9_9BACT
MKLPAIQFYPGDWHKDQGVQALDLAQRGAWFELLLMMHDSDVGVSQPGLKAGRRQSAAIPRAAAAVCLFA